MFEYVYDKYLHLESLLARCMTWNLKILIAIRYWDGNVDACSSRFQGTDVLVLILLEPKIQVV